MKHKDAGRGLRPNHFRSQRRLIQILRCHAPPGPVAVAASPRRVSSSLQALSAGKSLRGESSEQRQPARDRRPVNDTRSTPSSSRSATVH